MLYSTLKKNKKLVMLLFILVTVSLIILGFVNFDTNDNNYVAYAKSTSNSKLISIKFKHNNKTEKLKVFPITVGEFLESNDIEVDKYDIVSPSTSTVMKTGTKITYKDVEYKVKTKEKPIKFKTKYIKDSSLKSGTKIVEVKGLTGEKDVTFKMKYIDGKYKSNKVLKSVTTKKSRTKVIRIGTKSTVKGKTYSKVYTMKAYAYHEYSGARGSYGLLCKKGTIAVDPNIIPLGTKLYVKGYGFAIANDTGGMIKGKTIDVYMNSNSQCNSWGVKNVKVYVLS